METEDDFISDESSFYGDEDDKERFEILVETIAASEIHTRDTPRLIDIARENLSTTDERIDKRFNPHEGEPNAWQLHETADSFLGRVSPRTASGQESGPWLWVANPFAERPEQGARLAPFKEEAKSFLDDFLEVKQSLESTMEGKSAAAIAKKVNPRRKQTEGLILHAAQKHGVTAGKWMIFPMPDDVDECWRAVVEGTILGDLGTSAKVATDSGQGDRVPRVICVYTKDFADREDILRVLKALNRQGLVKNIYYKCDAYTYLDISSSNVWGIRASMYSSKEMLSGSGKT